MFGFLAIEDARVPFQYTFTVLSSMQGFLIFVLMVVRRRQVSTVEYAGIRINA